MRLYILICFSFLLFTEIFPQQDRYFYTGKDYGSEANYNPINLILNGSYDILQLDNSDRRIFKLPYGIGSKNVLKNLGSPFSAISSFGWGKFIRNEILPIEMDKNGAQWWPNYQLHLIGGGMTYTAMKEWYDYHGFPSPALFSVATLASYHLINEFVENERYEGNYVDPISDVYVFDIGGIILFSFDNVNKFFKEKLNLADWSLQPSINFSDLTLQNNGQYFSVKWKIPTQENWHLFYYFGMNGIGGLSYKFDDGTAFSAAAGMRAKRRYVINEKTDQMTIDMVWNAGVFYDKNNSLLASLLLSGQKDNLLNLNIYPGVVNLGKFSPGLWMLVKENGRFFFGISTIYTPGLGLQ
ncbi:MAG: hypothetical protein Q8933_19280 [Bacteroidota bacterium]|nr:hypothetical protein [Bacteroidota bacterium]MDP4191546.1 hypothetical protein [Bacteroidota bacterium]MDP4196074.1 hypothetical protein [Bacteroidota bacterium]